jgi:hypothetical protein
MDGEYLIAAVTDDRPAAVARLGGGVIIKIVAALGIFLGYPSTSAVGDHFIPIYQIQIHGIT